MNIKLQLQNWLYGCRQPQFRRISLSKHTPCQRIHNSRMIKIFLAMMSFEDSLNRPNLELLPQRHGLCHWFTIHFQQPLNKHTVGFQPLRMLSLKLMKSSSLRWMAYRKLPHYNPILDIVRFLLNFN